MTPLLEVAITGNDTNAWAYFTPTLQALPWDAAPTLLATPLATVFFLIPLFSVVGNNPGVIVTELLRCQMD